jgi:hypothetical protein
MAQAAGTPHAAARVRFRAEVLLVAPLGQGQGSELLEVRWRGDDGVVVEEVFDASSYASGATRCLCSQDPRCLLLC